MPFAATGDIDLYYEVHGPPPGAAPAIVFAHGMGGNHLSWWQQVPNFRDRFTCITFDHRGFGQSIEKPGGSSGAAFVDDLRALLDHLGLARVHLVAQSMGGWTCLGFTIRHPERVDRLVLCDTPGGLLTPEIGAAWSSKETNAVTLPEGVHPAAGARMYREQPALHFLYQQISELNPARTLAEMGEIIRAAGTVTPGTVAALAHPVLFVIGEEDIVIPPRALELAAGHFTNARIESVPQAGHSVYFERPQRFNEIVDNFLSARGQR
ncbi:MAG: alpha/beta hydrolase [Deltaproteobacteria bacterium]|nr:alpha/beta hydrolase [Deltaproteobacteria bacterium]MBI3386519.1 alpha/beta hydrolase [Deltaproteobacteria bacterium]